MLPRKPFSVSGLLRSWRVTITGLARALSILSFMRWREEDTSVQRKRSGKVASGASIGPQKLAERSYRPQRKESESFSESCLRMNEANRKKIIELALLFLKLGTIAFGGPAANIAMMEEEVVKRRGWLGHQQFLDLLGATNLIPGPNSTEMAIHIGL